MDPATHEHDPTEGAATRAELLEAWSRDAQASWRRLASVAALWPAVRRLPIAVFVTVLAGVAPQYPHAVVMALQVLVWWAAARFLAGSRLFRHGVGLVAALSLLGLHAFDLVGAGAAAEAVAAVAAVVAVGICIPPLVSSARDQLAALRRLREGPHRLRHPASRALPAGEIDPRLATVHDLRDDPEALLSYHGPLARDSGPGVPMRMVVAGVVGSVLGLVTAVLGAAPLVAGPSMVLAAASAVTIALGVFVALWALFFCGLVVPWSMSRELVRVVAEIDVHCARTAVRDGREPVAARLGAVPRGTALGVGGILLALIAYQVAVDPTLGVLIALGGLAVVIAVVAAVVAARRSSTRVLGLHGYCDDVRGLPPVPVEVIVDEAGVTVAALEADRPSFHLDRADVVAVVPIWLGVLDPPGVGIATADGDVLVILGRRIRRDGAMLDLWREKDPWAGEAGSAQVDPSGSWAASRAPRVPRALRAGTSGTRPPR